MVNLPRRVEPSRCERVRRIDVKRRIFIGFVFFYQVKTINFDEG